MIKLRVLLLSFAFFSQIGHADILYMRPGSIPSFFRLAKPMVNKAVSSGINPIPWLATSSLLYQFASFFQKNTQDTVKILEDANRREKIVNVAPNNKTSTKQALSERKQRIKKLKTQSFQDPYQLMLNQSEPTAEEAQEELFELLAQPFVLDFDQKNKPNILEWFETSLKPATPSSAARSYLVPGLWKAPTKTGSDNDDGAPAACSEKSCFEATIYDPSTGEIEDFNDYHLFISKIYELSTLEFEDPNERGETREESEESQGVPSENETYLWVRIRVGESREDLDTQQVPFLRLNKLLCKGPRAIRNADGLGWTLTPSEQHSSETLNRLYPGRHIGGLYITAIGNLDLDNSDNTTQDVVTEFDDIDIAYPRAQDYDFPLNFHQLQKSLLKLQDILSSRLDHRVVRNDEHKKALLTAAFFTSEAVRFNLVQFGAINLLQFQDQGSPEDSEVYQHWKNWRPILNSWNHLSKPLSEIRGRQDGLGPLLTFGIPIYTGIRLFSERSMFRGEPVCSVISLISDQGSRDLLERLQYRVLLDLLNTNPTLYHSVEGIPPPFFIGEIRGGIFDILSEQFAETLQRAGNDAAANKNYREALTLFQRALGLYKVIEIRSQSNISHKLQAKIGVMLHRLGQYREAISALEIAKLFYKEHADSDPESSKLLETIEKVLGACSEAISRSQQATSTALE